MQIEGDSAALAVFIASCVALAGPKIGFSFFVGIVIQDALSMAEYAHTRRNGMPKPKHGSGDFTSDLDVSSFGIDDKVDIPLDPLFTDYYRPEVPQPDDTPAFIADVERDNKAMLKHMEEADRFSMFRNTQRAVQSGVDAHYFFCVVFVSEDQKKEFLQKTGWDRFGGSRFLNGIMLAEACGVDLQPAYLATATHADRAMVEVGNESSEGEV
jgi:hypothetical protein